MTLKRHLWTMLVTAGLAALIAGCGGAAVAPASSSPEPATVDADIEYTGGGRTIEGWQPTTNPEQVVQQAAESSIFAAWLAQHPDWVGFATSEEEEGAAMWWVEFFDGDPEDENAIGWVWLNGDEGIAVEWRIPRALTEEERAAGERAVTELVMGDAEIMAMLGDPARWDLDIAYFAAEDFWVAEFSQGAEMLEVVLFEESGEGFFIEEIWSDSILSPDEAAQQARYMAVDLAFTAPGISEALAGTDDWTTYVEQQGSTVWSVSFVSQGEELFFAVVDVAAETVIETTP